MYTSCKDTLIAIGIAVCLLTATGCFTNNRCCAIADFNEIGKSVRTMYRYEIISDKEYFRGTGTTIAEFNAKAIRMYPGVFCTDGIPVVMAYRNSFEPSHTFHLGPLNLILPIPYIESQTIPATITIALPDAPGVSSKFSIRCKNDHAMSLWLPTSYLCFNGSGAEPGKPCCENHDKQFGIPRPSNSTEYSNKIAFEFPISGLAAKLKEMEDAGIINDDIVRKWENRKNAMAALRRQEAEAKEAARENARRQEEERRKQLALEQERRRQEAAREQLLLQQMSVQQSRPTSPAHSPAYKIISCKRDAGRDFSYRFVLELKGEEQNSLRTFRAVQQEFRATIREDYAESFPGIRLDSLYVDFPEYELKGGRIEGRAVVMTISVVSLTYEPNTKKGKLAVKTGNNMSPEQFEETRKWIRKNIETLARDKNIALITGQVPPDARFYLGKEEVKDGNVLEIEFSTE